MKESDNKDVSNRAYRLLVPYSNTVDMAKKILLFYNGYLMASGNEKNVIDARHLNLLAYYFVFGYSYETKKKFSHCFSTDLQYVSVLDTEMKKRGILIDREGNYRTRCLCPDIENMRRLLYWRVQEINVRWFLYFTERKLLNQMPKNDFPISFESHIIDDVMDKTGAFTTETKYVTFSEPVFLMPITYVRTQITCLYRFRMWVIWFVTFMRWRGANITLSVLNPR